jgi:hypothetical protein
VEAIVVPEDLPKPSTAVASTRELAAFLNTAAFDAPTWDRFRLACPPRGAGQLRFAAYAALASLGRRS